MAPLGALTQAWTAAEASLPLGWRVAGLCFSMTVGSTAQPAFVDHVGRRGGSQGYVERAARNGRADAQTDALRHSA